MSLFISSLNSGSNGNCYYIGNDNEAVLIDAGISCRETENRMKKLGLSMNKVKAIFISHEHSDHIRGLPYISRKYGIPVFISPPTARNCPFVLDAEILIPLQPYQEVIIGNLGITGFPKWHDAIDPCSFIVEYDKVKVGIFTDIGKPCEHVIYHFSQCHAAFLETNYDDQMLTNGHYPTHLKNRIRGGRGHLSNRQALELFQTHRPAYMTHLLLSHLSQENNHPDLVLNLFEQAAGSIKIIVAGRYQETAIYEIGSQTNNVNIASQQVLFPDAIA